MQVAFITEEHLLLALISAGEKNISEMFSRFQITENAVNALISTMRNGQKVTDNDPENKMNTLKKYGIDLIAQAKAGKIDPVIGREEEIRRTLQILSRRTKNNPVLVGEP